MDKNSVILAIACACNGVTRRGEIIKEVGQKHWPMADAQQNYLSKPYYCSNFFGGVQFEKVNPHSLNPYGFCNAHRFFLRNG